MSRTNPMAYVMELVGSLVYIVLLLYTLTAFSTYASSNGLFIQAANGFWLPVIYALAAVMTVMLFLVSFTNLMASRTAMGHKYPVFIAILAGFSWIALSAGNSSMTAFALLGFIISLVGGVFGWMQEGAE